MWANVPFHGQKRISSAWARFPALPPLSLSLLPLFRQNSSGLCASSLLFRCCASDSAADGGWKLCAVLRKLRSARLVRCVHFKRFLHAQNTKNTKTAAKMHCVMNFQAFSSCHFALVEWKCVCADWWRLQSGGRGGGGGGESGGRTLKIYRI